MSFKKLHGEVATYLMAAPGLEIAFKRAVSKAFIDLKLGQAYIDGQLADRLFDVTGHRVRAQLYRFLISLRKEGAKGDLKHATALYYLSLADTDYRAVARAIDASLFGEGGSFENAFGWRPRHSFENPIPIKQAATDDKPAENDDETERSIDPSIIAFSNQTFPNLPPLEREVFTLLCLLKEPCSLAMMNALLLGGNIPSFDDLSSNVLRWCKYVGEGENYSISINKENLKIDFRISIGKSISSRHISLVKQLCIENDHTVEYALRCLPWHLMEIGMAGHASTMVARTGFREERDNAFSEAESLRLFGRDLALFQIAMFSDETKIQENIEAFRTLARAGTQSRYLQEKGSLRLSGPNSYVMSKNYMNDLLNYKERLDNSIINGAASLSDFIYDEFAVEMLSFEAEKVLSLMSFNNWLDEES